MTKKNNWNLQEMQETLVKDTEQRISDGFQEIANVDSVAVPQQPSDQQAKEQTKGVQTYIPMSMYRRLNDIKLTRRENIANLVMQAIGLWLDVQEGKKKVSATI